MGTTKTRTAILLDENGIEIFRGHPSDMPVRWSDDLGGLHDWTMNNVAEAGTPIDEESGEDLEIHDAG
jgi:hypothetical protein